MRAFVSVDCTLPSEAIRRVQRPFARIDGLRLTDPERTHLTLWFLGDVDTTFADHARSVGGESPDDRFVDEQFLDDRHDGPGVRALVSALESAVEANGVSPFDCSFEGYGTFPEGGGVSVVWMGVDDGRWELTHLSATIEAAAVDFGSTPPHTRSRPI